MSEADVIIVGAGMGGLTSGCLLAQRGLDVLMVEKNQKVGGCCTSFERDGFTFDLSVQSIGECQEGGRIWNLLRRFDLLNQFHFIPLEPARQYHFPGKQVTQSSSLDAHIENLSRFFPEERGNVEEVYDVLKNVFDELSNIPSSFNWFDPSSFTSRYPFLSKYKDRTYAELLHQFISDPFLKTILSIRSSYALLPPEEISVIGMAGIEMSYFNAGVSCIEGKVEQLPLKLGETFEKQGGRMLLGQEVSKILVEEKGAVGIRLKDGQEFRGGAIISNMDAHATFSHLLGEDRVPAGFGAKLKGMRPSLSYFILYLGVDGKMDELQASNNEIFFDRRLSGEYQALYANRIPEDPPFYLLAPSKVNPSHAPEGKSTLCLSYKTSYQLDADWGGRMKEELSRRLIARASAFVPDLEKRILLKIEATPRTIEQWTGNRWGAAYGWAQIPSQSGIHRLPRTTPVNNLYLTGHWTSPGGGIAGVVASGELTAEAVLKTFEKGACQDG